MQVTTSPGAAAELDPDRTGVQYRVPKCTRSCMCEYPPTANLGTDSRRQCTIVFDRTIA